MRIVVLTQNFPPEVGAKSARLYKMTNRLAERGHRVTVITAMPNYPTGRTFDGYRGKIRSEDEADGVRIIRTWILPSKSPKALPRFMSYTSFAMSSLILGAWGLGRQDIVLFDTPPLSLVPTGLAIGRITGARVIMNVSDIWPDVAIRLGEPVSRVPMWALRRLERLGYEKSDVVAATTDTARQQIVRQFPQVRTTVISNGADLRMFSPSLRTQEVRDSFGVGPEDFLVGYFGLHGLFQGLEVVVEAAEKLCDHREDHFPHGRRRPLQGDALIDLAERKRLDNLRFLGLLPWQRIPSILASCDAGLVPLAAEFPGTTPSKVYETLASGVPVVISKGCESADLIEHENAGRTFRPGDSNELADALIELDANGDELAQIRKNCRKLAERFDYDRIALEIEAILTAVARRRSDPRIRPLTLTRPRTSPDPGPPYRCPTLPPGPPARTR